MADAAGRRAHVCALWRAAARHALSDARRFEATHAFLAPGTLVERCVRHSFSAATETWSTSETHCRLESVSFAEGAMRRCFRLLKETQAPGISAEYAHDWGHASAYVAKRYKDEAVGVEQYRRDVEMQQKAARSRPGRVSVAPHAVAEAIRRRLQRSAPAQGPGSPIFACERMVRGAYVKHNNNSGFVEAERRATPQAFSHFTHASSGGALIVVDIQGVNDLYTDPQLHTLAGAGDAGEGNLGVRGMALFFNAHRCSPLCALLRLPPLPKAPSDLARDAAAAAASPAASASSLASAASGLGLDGATALQRSWRREAPAAPAAPPEPPRGDTPRVPLSALPAWATAEGAWARWPAPPDAAAAAFAPVHLSLAIQCAVGSLPLLGCEPDGPAALFHAAQAARGGCARAARALRDLSRGVPSDLLPGLRLEGELLVLAAELTRALAASGDAEAAAEVAAEASAAGRPAEAAAWLRAALAAEGAGEGAEGRERRMRLLEALGHACAACGEAAAAAAAFDSASEEAAAAGRGKAAMRLAALAEAAEAEVAT